MCAALIGGMDRLRSQYKQTAKRNGVKVRHFTGKESRIASKLGSSDLVIVFTNKVSHKARNEVVRQAKRDNIPVHMCHSCGVSTLDQTLKELTAK